MADPVTTNTTPSARGCTSCGASNAPSARFCATCGAGLPTLTAPGAAPGSLGALLDDARQHLLLGHWEDAGLAAEAVLTLDPASAEGHHIAARSRLKQGMRASALTHAERALELDPHNGEYQSTLAEALRANDTAGPRISVPAMVASVVAVLVLGFIAVLALVNRGEEPIRGATPAGAQTAPGTPFAQPPGNTPFPQPQRQAGVDTDRPRIAPRTAAPPDPGDAGRSAVSTAPRGAVAALPPAGAGVPTPGAGPNLAPAPVDSSPLQRFPEPSQRQPVTAPAPPQRGATVPPYTQPPTPPNVVAAPPAQPGGTIFGTGPTTPPRTTTPQPTNPFTPGPSQVMPEPPAPSPAPTSPQQEFLQRNYGGAIQGLERQIQAGQATGAKYQQLGAAYTQVGDRGRAAEAYQNAIAAYRAQIQAGQDVDVATRGLRNTQNALAMLQSH